MHYRTNVIYSIIISCALVFFLLAPVNGIAQSEKAEPRQNKQDTTGRKLSPLAEMLAAAEAEHSYGWLILNGEFIPGPYEIDIGDSNVTVNGRKVFFERAQKKVEDVDSNAVAQHHLIDTLFGKFRAWHAEKGIDTARQRTLDFLKNRPIVDTAYFLGDFYLQLKFEGVQFFEGMELISRKSGKRDLEGMFRANLLRFGQMLKSALARKCLVITYGGGGYMSFNYPRSEFIMKELQKAVKIPDLDERTTAITEIIHNRTMARIIAEPIMQK